jgi:hypothetical protein
MKITGRLAKTDTNPASTGVYGRIYLNHNLIYEHFVAGTDGTGVDYSLTETVRSGDILDFAVAPNGVAYNDSTVFSSVIWTNSSGGSERESGRGSSSIFDPFRADSRWAGLLRPLHLD